jgi:hypothetical protein
MNKKENRFYVYALLDPRKPGEYKYGDISFSYEPFYIGKGTGYRIYSHIFLSNIKRNRNPHKVNKIKSIEKNGLSVIKLKIIDNIEEELALKIEKNIIEIIGRHNQKEGPLTNIDEGGRKCPKMTQKIKNRISRTNKNKYSSGEIIHPWLGKKHSDATKIKISQNHSNFWDGRKHSNETKTKMKKSHEGKKILLLCNEYKFVSPENKIFIVNTGIKDFCKKHNLTYSCISKVLRNKRNHHKGWKCYKIKNKNTGGPKIYKCISPCGEEFIITDGLKKFCDPRYLSYCNLIKVAQGQRNNHKGWKCEYYPSKD